LQVAVEELAVSLTPQLVEVEELAAISLAELQLLALQEIW
jgi:hypothetical protein